jgi:hypothetical protein
MAERQQYRYTVTVEAAQHGRGAMLTWHVYRARVDDQVRTLWKTRRVLIASVGVLNVPQLTGLVLRMATYVLLGAGPSAHVPKGLPWREPGRTEWSVPPGGGEGGAKDYPHMPHQIGPKDDPTLTGRLI